MTGWGKDSFTGGNYQHVLKEVEVPVTHYTYAVAETGCVNSFGAQVPCAQSGEARRKRAADEEEAAAGTASVVVKMKPQLLFFKLQAKTSLMFL